MMISLICHLAMAPGADGNFLDLRTLELKSRFLLMIAVVNRFNCDMVSNLG